MRQSWDTTRTFFGEFLELWLGSRFWLVFWVELWFGSGLVSWVGSGLVVVSFSLCRDQDDVGKRGDDRSSLSWVSPRVCGPFSGSLDLDLAVDVVVDVVVGEETAGSVVCSCLHTDDDAPA